MPMPTIFAAHGAPVLLDDAVWVGELADWAKNMPRPESVLMVSAHWEERPATLGATRSVPLVYDFFGFPEQYYRMRYPAPGAPRLAALTCTQCQDTIPAGSGPDMTTGSSEAPAPTKTDCDSRH